MGGDQRPVIGDGVSEISGEMLGSSSSSTKPHRQQPHPVLLGNCGSMHGMELCAGVVFHHQRFGSSIGGLDQHTPTAASTA